MNKKMIVFVKQKCYYGIGLDGGARERMIGCFEKKICFDYKCIND
jgi:hypothetical protein